jgi:hypothetical protein
MQTQLELFAQSFENEEALRGAICDLLAKIPSISGIDPTHGLIEHGKDIVFTMTLGLDERILCACVVKNV